MVIEPIKLIIENIPLFMLLLAFIFSGVTVFRHHEKVSNTFVLDTFLDYLLFFVVGVTLIWTFFINLFLPSHLISFLGWVSGPFHIEVAAANIGIGIAALFALRSSFTYKIPVVLISTCFLWGFALEYIQTNAEQHINNPDQFLGSTFYIALLVPIITVILTIARHLYSKSK